MVSLLKQQFLLGVDLGTSSVKAVILNLDGDVKHEVSAGLPPVIVKGLQVEANPELWWSALKQVLAEVFKGFKPSDILAMCVGGQGPSLVSVNKQGRPLYNSIIWMDRRATEEADLIKKITGDAVDPYLLETKISWLKQHRPEVYKKTFKFLNAYEFISYRLTNRAHAGVIRSGYIPWSNIPYWSPDHLNAVHVDLEKLPETLAVGKVIGPVTEKAASETGLSKKTLVVQGVTDFVHAILGSGTIRSGIALDYGGTSQGFNLCWDEPLHDPQNRILITPHIIPDHWNIGGMMSTSGVILAWFKEIFGREEVEEASKTNADPYDKLCDLASRVQAGSKGLLLLPYFAGERSPIWDPNAKGVLFGLTLSHRKEHFVRAILEATSYGLRHIKETIESAGGNVREVRSAGGQSRSSLWCQIKADVLNVPVLQLVHESAEPLGSAIVAGVGVGAFKDYVEAAEKAIKIRATFEPDPRNFEKYSKWFEGYKKLYASLRDLFKETANY